jgi:arylsulfatase A-like enzyme
MHVLLLLARGLHLGYLGCYGNDWIDTPALDRLAAEGVVFDQHIADCPDPAGARRAGRTGRYHFPLADDAPDPDPAADLLELLRAADIATVELTDPTPAEASEALGRLAALPRGLLHVELTALLPPWQTPGQFRTRYFREQAKTDEEEEALTPLTDPPIGPLDDPDDVLFRRIQRSYAGAVAHLDSGIDALVEALRRRGLLEGILLLVTSDHGQALGEHGIVGPYRPWLHEELIHLPLIVRLPGAAEAGRRVFHLSQPVDLMPTLLDVFGLPIPEVHGRSLRALWHGGEEPLRAYACAGLRIGAAIEWALRTPEWAFLLPVQTPPDDPPRRPQLYVKPDDRWEVNNVLQHHLERGEHFEQVLRDFVAATRCAGPLQPPALSDVAAQSATSAAAADESTDR